MKTQFIRIAATVVAMFVAVGAPSHLFADMATVRIWGSDGIDSYVDTIQIPIDDNGLFNGQGTSISPIWSIDWDVDGNADPIVNSNFTASNALGVPLDFNVLVTVPAIPPLSSPTRSSGSIGITTTDTNGNGATVSSRASLGTPIYSALVDSVLHKSLMDHVTTISAPAFGTGTASADFGLPGTTFPGGAVSVDAGLRVQFTLSARDIAAVTSTFTIIPEPAGILLGVLAAVGTLVMFRRRS